MIESCSSIGAQPTARYVHLARESVKEAVVRTPASIGEDVPRERRTQVAFGSE